MWKNIWMAELNDGPELNKNLGYLGQNILFSYDSF